MSWLRDAKSLVLPYAIGLLVTFAGCAAVTYWLDTWPWADQRTLRERYLLERVSRADLAPILQAPGGLESSKRTIVKCQLENITGGGAMGAASTILTVLPEGTPVKKGDVLAKLDAAAFEEMLRQQEITVEQAKASHLQAKLNHEIALLAVREYREGTVQETLESMEGTIALARSDLSRAQDHLDWSRRMNAKGYTAPAAIVSEVHSVTQLDFSLKRQETSLELFRRFTLPKTEKTLLGQVRAAETVLGNETLRLQRQLERQAKLKAQVEYCTIRAPHDGVLFYVKGSGGGGRTPQVIEEGLAVRQSQQLFYLPDLSELEVEVALNESVVDRVVIGLHATVRFEALPKIVLEGKLATIGQIPFGQSRNGEDIRYFVARVKLDHSAAGLRPGMTTRVDIALAPRRDVLTVPHEAVRIDGERKVCFVAHDEQLECRDVQVGEDTIDLIEVTEGLKEGELVALNPPTSLGHMRPLLRIFDSAPAPSPPATVVTSQR
jgi:HlyD family secretion protein